MLDILRVTTGITFTSRSRGKLIPKLSASVKASLLLFVSYWFSRKCCNHLANPLHCLVILPTSWPSIVTTFMDKEGLQKQLDIELYKYYIT